MTRKKRKKKTWSSGQEWDGFRPTAYSLSDRVWELHIDRLIKDSPGESEPATRTPISVGEAFKLFNWGNDERCQPVETGKPIGEIKTAFLRAVEGEKGLPYLLTVESSSGQERFQGSRFSVHLLEALLRLGKAGTNPFEASLFFYDSDSSTHDPADDYDFFVVCNDTIVQERVRFSDSPRDAFDHTVLSAPAGDDPFSFRENDKSEAWVRFWYRKFYTETRTGQLMVLRPDEPQLYFYPEGRYAWKLPMVLTQLEQRNNAFLMALVIIGLIALILLWR